MYFKQKAVPSFPTLNFKIYLVSSFISQIISTIQISLNLFIRGNFFGELNGVTNAITSLSNLKQSF